MKSNKEIVFSIGIILVLIIIFLFFIFELKHTREYQVRKVITNLEEELVYDFSNFESMQEEYIINDRNINIDLYKSKLDNSFKEVEEYKSKIWNENINCNRNSNSLDKRIVFLNNTYNMLKQSEDQVIKAYSEEDYSRFEDVLKCVNGHLKESFYDTKNHSF
ncbi:hypothetical protein [Clostridium sp. B9]|uniref:hypothetical protein n=1 Tax=Clostridium sp. B9 TaxID=3423224 RepID=UPI003D2F2630